MKKTALIFVICIVVLIIGIFGFRSCQNDQLPSDDYVAVISSIEFGPSQTTYIYSDKRYVVVSGGTAVGVEDEVRKRGRLSNWEEVRSLQDSYSHFNSIRLNNEEVSMDDLIKYLNENY